MITMKMVDIYYVDQNGVQFNTGFKTLKTNGKFQTYFFQINGKARKGWMKLNGNWYYFTKGSGVMLQNCKVTNSKGQTYKFNAQGICTNRR